ncbi:glycoside hydrolase family 172 protein [Plantibacter sp. VKM Ac-2876]|uniref:glycoside hydrolase family 172 protein n=1 Tax=Plantibacter sp. VKM Ac-2876 TaxID=2783826 RepID=UPI00188D6F10|nr:glycoside hydrolase family 172 protein [Plantibacter sp. VKM Ac-2876]MBF4563997.1 DUF2961 domain-containing protein [Plantibacter sp. VKM Ac-2876]
MTEEKNVVWEQYFSAPTGVRSRSINAENPTGEPGQAAQAASALGVGRKGRPAISLVAGATATLAEIDGPGVIRHIWMTVPDATSAGPWVLRDLVLRITWERAGSPAVEVPLGDFFCNGFGARTPVNSAAIVVASTGGMNCYFAMPFAEHAKVEIVNQHPGDVSGIYYQIDYTVGDELPAELARFHAQWRRSNGTTRPGEDHVILDGVEGSGQYVGTYIGLTALERYWWGEGETKFFIDDDTTFPSQTSTGLEDYAGGAWAFQDRLANDGPISPVLFSAPYSGYPYYSAEDTSGHSPFLRATPQSHGMYRWHLPDPVIFSAQLRVTLQQIGAWDHGHFERSDDISSVAYWYQTGLTPARSLDSAAERRPR